MVSNASCTCTLLACIATIILLDDFFFFFLIVLRFLELPSLKFGGCIYSLYIAIPLYCKLFFFCRCCSRLPVLPGMKVSNCNIFSPLFFFLISFFFLGGGDG